MKTIITSAKGAPLRRILCSFLFGAAAFCVVPTNIQAANIQAPGDIIWAATWASTGDTVGKYNANGTAINTNFITIPNPGQGYAAYIGGILVSGTTLYVATIRDVTWARLYYLMYHPPPYITVVATYNAAAPGNVINSSFFSYGPRNFPQGMALSGPYLYVATSQGSISQIATTGGGNNSFIGSGPQSPYALAVGGPNGSVLYVTNNQNSNGPLFISTWNAYTGEVNNGNFIEIPTDGLYGLALLGNTLYVSVYNGFNGSAPSPPGVYTYNATAGAQLHGQGSFFPVNEPGGIAIGSPPANAPSNGNPTLYVASNQDSAIYEFDAITGAPLPYSIKVSGTLMSITVELATPH